MADNKQTNVPAPAPANGGAVEPKVNPKTLALKNVLNTDSVKEQFKNALGKNADTFIASVIDLFNSDSKLRECNPNQVVMEALKAAVLHLPINKSLGFAYIIPYSNSYPKKDEYGRDMIGQDGKKIWEKKLEPTFQLGYKGYIQLAMRTGQYRTLNADVVYDGEVRKVSKLTGEIAFDGEKKSDKVIGYFCYFELLNGFAKTLYMTVDQMANHAKRYSKGLKKEVTVDQLKALADLPVSTDDNKTVGWLGNFHSMGVKTVVRNLLSKFGYLSVEMQTSIADDMRSEEWADATEVKDDQKQLTMSSEGAVQIGEAATSQPAPASAPNPGY